MSVQRLSGVEVIERYDQMKKEKTPWLEQYQLIGEYIRIRKQNFTEENTEGEFLTEHIFDSTAILSNRQMASALIGLLWPSGSRTFRLIKSDDIEDTTEIKEYFDKVSREMQKYMDNPKAQLKVALNEYMLDQGGFGISGITVNEKDDPETPVTYRSENVKNMVVDENEEGLIDTIGLSYPRTVKQIVQEYGIENVSKEIRDSFKKKKYDDKKKIVILVTPRLGMVSRNRGNKFYPIATYHVEYDTKKKLRESGFEKMRTLVSRMSKAAGEKYGRSPGTEALPDILLANAMAESLLRAAEKQLDPPLNVVNDGLMNGAEIDSSAGGINVISSTGQIPVDKQISPMFTVGEMRSTLELLERIQEKIAQHFHIDRLLDLNNDTRMTLGEAQIRNQIRGEALGNLLSRQETELFSPLIELTFQILFEKGLLGVPANSEKAREDRALGKIPFIIPEAIYSRMQRGEDIYKIDYISPARRMMFAEQVRGIFTTMELTAQVASIEPKVIYALDWVANIKTVAEMTGVPEANLQSTDYIEKRFEELQQSQQLKDAMSMFQQFGQGTRDTAQAQVMAAEASNK